MNISTFLKSAATMAVASVFSLSAYAGTVPLIGTDPEQGQVEELSSVTLSFSAAVSAATGVDLNTAFTVKDQDGKEYAYTAVANSRRANIVMTLSEKITTPGTYTVNLPEGSVSVAGSGDTNANINLKYTIAAPAAELPTLEYMAFPEEEEPLESLSTLMLYLPEVEEISIVAWETNDASLAYATVEKDNKTVTRGMLDISTYMRMEVLSIEFDDVVSEPGTYTVVIPSGAIKDASTGTVYGKLELTYTVEGLADAVYTVSPVNGSELEKLSGDIRFTYTDYAKIGNANGPMMIDVLDADGKSVGKFESSLPGFANVVQISIDEDDAITTPGTYTITIPAGGIVGFINEDGDSKPLGAATVTYTVTGATTPDTPETPAYTVSINPAEGNVTELAQFVITFDGATKIKASDEAGPKDYPYYATVDGEGKITKVSQMRASAYGVDNTMELNTYTTVTTPGSYAIVVPSTYYFVDGNQPAEQLVFYYTIPAPEVKMSMEVEFINVEEEESHEDLDKIEFKFVVYDNDYNAINSGLTFKRDSTKAPKMGLLNENGSQVEKYNNGTISGTDPHLIWSSYYGVTTDGFYLFSIPANYMKATDADGNVVTNDDVYAMFILERPESGIENIRVELLDSNSVYNLRGIKVGESLENLPAGIYIRRGKKIIVK
jgi:hypothetical protein